MTVYSGIVSELGEGIRGGPATQYSYIKIGDKRIRDVVVESFMNNFITVGENMSISVAEFYKRNVVMAVKRADGEILRHDKFATTLFRNQFGVLVMILIGAGIGGAVISPLLRLLLPIVIPSIVSVVGFFGVLALLLYLGPISTFARFYGARSALG